MRPITPPRSPSYLKLLAALTAGALALPALAQPLGTSFVYQASLSNNGVPASGLHDFRFRLFDAASGGAQIGPELCADDVTLTAGGMTISLDFGSQFAGQRRFLEVRVRQDVATDCSDTGGYATLEPLMEITPTPHALFALNAGTATTATSALTAGSATTAVSATTATTATTAANADLLGGQAGSFYQNAANLTGTLGDARLGGTYSGLLTFSNAANAFSGSGAGLTNLSASNLTSGTLPSAALSGAYTSVLTFSNAANVFSGSGAGLTALSAANISTGTLSDARLSANVAMRNAANAFGNFTNSFGGNVGIGQPAPGFPLTFDSTNGDKVALFGNSGAHYGFGIASSLLQIHSNTSASDIAFGYGSSAAFTETMRIKGNGRVGVGLNPVNDFEVGGGTDVLTVDVTVVPGAIRVGNLTNETSVMSMVSRGDAEVVIDSNNNEANTRVFRFMKNGSTGTSPGVGVELARVQEDGRMGIGTAALADAMLHTFTSTRSSSATIETSVAGGVALTAIASATTADTAAGNFSTESNAGTGVYAIANANSGVTYGVQGFMDSNSANAMGVRGEALRSGANYGVYGSAPGASSFGVYANGRLGSSGTKSFMIDHPLDPENKYLLHYSAESPDVLNIYSGMAQLDAQGEVWITLPEYFEAINTDPRYSLTSVGAPAPMLHVADEVSGNRFHVAGGAPNAKVSWEIKAVRNDRFVQTYGAPVERVKVDGERGTYLRPELYGKPASQAQFAPPARVRPEATAPAAPTAPAAQR